MPQAKSKSANNFAALTFELVTGADGVVPNEAHLLPVGPFRSDDGRPVECKAWLLDSAIAKKLIALAASKKTDMLIDYEHQSLRSIENGKPAPAAGWCPNTLEWREPSTGSGRTVAGGLYAVQIGWTESAKRRISGKEYRYISSVFSYSPKTGEVLEIISFTLTNTPAIDGLEALADMARVALARGSDLSTKTGVKTMDEDEKKVAALTTQNTELNNKVAVLTTQNTEMTGKVAALTTQNAELTAKVAAVDKDKAEAALAADKAKHAELLQAALTDGRLVPAQKPWAEKQSLAALTEYLEATKPIAILTKQVDGKEAAGSHGLSDVELAYCTKMNVKPEDYAKTKADK